MFGADATVQSMYDYTEVTPNKPNHKEPTREDTNNIDYLFPKFCIQQPWLRASASGVGNHVGEDFILIAEFSEQEGPRPVIVIPKDGGEHFDQNDFSVKILSVDHQSSFVEGCHLSEDTQVVMSDAEKQVHAFVHHIVLNDIQARGYVRPFCISYVTSDSRKLMACYDEMSTQLKKVARLMKYGNRLVFMRDLEKHQEDLSFTKAHLLLHQNRMASSTAQGDNDLLNVLNALRQSMEEVRDILSKLKPLLNDHELDERFQHFEKLLKISASNRRHSLEDSCSLKEFDHQKSQDESSCGSFTETLLPEFSLFNKSKDQKPKVLDVSIIKGKRRFDRSLRGLHELCSWGAKDGLQRLRLVREFFKRDLSSIYIDDIDSAVLDPDCGVLSFGTDCIGANFLSSESSLKGFCWEKPSCYKPGSQDNLISLGSLDSFKSLSSSFQSFIDDDEMYSAKSSVMENYSSGDGINFVAEKYSSKDSVDFEQERTGTRLINYAAIQTVDSQGPQNMDELEKTLNDTLTETITAGRPRTSTTVSEYDIIEIETDLKCNSKGCYHSKDMNTCNDQRKHNRTLENENTGEIVSDACNGGLQSLAGTRTILKQNSPKVCDSSSKGFSDLKLATQDVSEKEDMTNENRAAASAHFDNLTERNSQNCDSVNKRCNSSGKLVGISEVFQPHAEYSINEVSSDLVEEFTVKVNDSVQKTSDSFMSTDIIETKALSDQDNNWRDHNKKRLEGDSDFIAFKSEMKRCSRDNIRRTSDSEKLKEHIEPINGLWQRDNNLSSSATERSSDDETRHKRIRRKWRLTHPLKDLTESNHFQDHGLLKVLTSYNNLQHVIYSLLSGRPVIVIGTRRHETILRELLQALNVFVPVVPGCDSVSLLCQLKQLKIVDIHKFLLRGIIRSEKKCLEYIIPQSVRRYITLFDVEKSLISCVPYQGSLLNFISAIYHKKKVFKSEPALHTFIQMYLMEISTKAFSFYHCMCIPDMESNFSGVTLTRKSSMLELSADKYLNKAGLLNADSRIIKHLAEIVKIQQIDQEFKCRSLTDSPVYPFTISYNTVQTFRC